MQPAFPPLTPARAVGLYLLAWAIFTAYMTIASWRVSMGVFAVFVFLTLTFIALFIGAFAGASGMTMLGGWLGIVTALIAWYCSLAVVANSTYKRDRAPGGTTVTGDGRLPDRIG